MEINSGVMMSNLINQLDDGYLIAKEIYKEAIKKMFKKLYNSKVFYFVTSTQVKSREFLSSSKLILITQLVSPPEGYNIL